MQGRTTTQDASIRAQVILLLLATDQCHYYAWLLSPPPGPSPPQGTFHARCLALEVTGGVQKASRAPGEGKAALKEIMGTDSSCHMSPSLMRALSLASGTPNALQRHGTRCWSSCLLGCMPSLALQGSHTALLVLCWLTCQHVGARSHAVRHTVHLDAISISALL